MGMSRTSISIVVVALNEQKRLPLLLKSIEVWLNSDAPLEVILIDNGSVDGTLQIMRRYSDRYDSVRVLRYTGAFGSTWNLGVRLARGEYVVFMGADMALPSNWLNTFKELVSRYKECDAFVAKLLPLFRYRGSLNDYIRGYFLGDTAEDGRWHEHTFHSGGLIVRREVAVKVGFKPNLAVAVDGDFSYRFLQHGYKACYLPSKYFVFDEQYYDLSGFLRFFKKLGLGAVVLLRSTRSTAVAYTLLKTFLEPLTPHYLVLRYKRARSSVKISHSIWILVGLVRLYIIFYTLILYGILGKKIPTRVVRKKI